LNVNIAKQRGRGCGGGGGGSGGGKNVEDLSDELISKTLMIQIILMIQIMNSVFGITRFVM